MTRLMSFMVAALTIASAAGVESPIVQSRPGLTLEGARRVLAAAEAMAIKNGATPAVAVVDEGGHLIALHRLDGCFAAAAEVSIGKARTAAVFKKPTSAFEEVIRAGRTSMVALERFTPLQGGVPIVVDGQIVGAVGVSGAASAQQDEEIALAAAGVLMERKSQ